jgi:hypothetical protein
LTTGGGLVGFRSSKSLPDDSLSLELLPFLFFVRTGAFEITEVAATGAFLATIAYNLDPVSNWTPGSSSDSSDSINLAFFLTGSGTFYSIIFGSLALAKGFFATGARSTLGGPTLLEIEAL